MPLISSVTRDKSVGCAAQQRDNAFDGKFDIQRRAKLTGFGVEAKQPPPGFDLAGFRQLHADNAIVAPCDAAPANACVEYCVPTPRHYANHPESIITPSQKRAPGKFRSG
jgi:hypothetical protein